MKITIDVQPLLGKKSGVGYYIWGLIHGLAEIDSQNKYQLAFFDFKNRASQVPDLGKNFNKRTSPVPGRAISLLWKYFGWPDYQLFFGKADVFHFPNFIIRPIHRSKKVVTIHDVSFLRHPEYTERKNLKFLTSKINETIHEADQIIVDSAFTKDEMMHFFRELPPEKINVIHLGLDQRFTNMQRPKTKQILFVGTIEPRKNLINLLEAYKILMRDRKFNEYRMVIAGMKGWLCEEVFMNIERHEFKNKIIWKDYVSDEELPRLYQESEVFVYPSYYEGFGLPPLEAMACGVPVIATQRGSLPEVLGDAPVWVDPGRPAEIAESFKLIIENAAVRENMIKKGLDQAKKFCWRRAATETINVYKRCIG